MHAAGIDDDMDANEREIARILAEEANLMDAHDIAAQVNAGGNANARADFGSGDMMGDGGAMDEPGVRQADEQRVQALMGDDADDDDDYNYSQHMHEDIHAQLARHRAHDPVAQRFAGRRGFEQPEP